MSPQAISLIMPTIDWGPTFQRCLQTGATLLQTDNRQGPAAARNLPPAKPMGNPLIAHGSSS